MLLSLPQARAQQKTYPNNLAMDSVDPEGDAEFIRQVKERLNEVRRTENRPTVALVLSGGGAKGAAQAGALKYLEERNVPVDLICGTSIGGLIGGLYSIGYSADDIIDLFRTQDWGVTLTDRIDPKYIPYSRKMDKEKYFISIPFRYEKRTVKAILEDQLRYGREERNRNMDEDQAHIDSRMELSRLTSSLPSGYAYGFNVNNLLASMTVGYQDSISFAQLPIPYMCVASDMVSCMEKNWGSGSLNVALRSTMSIPGLFDPVRDHGMILVDGGTRNNFPTDVARACGADYIIGIELGDLDPEYYQVNHLGNLVSQFIKMLGKDAYDKNINRSDVFIKPSISDYNMLSFNREAVDTMYRRGYEAAKAAKSDLDAVMSWMPNTGRKELDSRAVNISTVAVPIRSIEFEGLTKTEASMLRHKMHLKAGKLVTKSEMDKAMSKLQATGAFNSVRYSLKGEEEPYDLVFHCERGPVNQVDLGFRMDNLEWAALTCNLGLNTHKLMGSKLNLSAKLGQNRFIDATWSLDLPYLPTFNVEFNWNYHKGNMFDGPDKYNISYRSYDAKAFFSNIRWTAVDFRVGAVQRYAHMPDDWIMSNKDRKIQGMNSNYLGGFAEGIIYTFDNKYYPSKGMNFRVSYNYIFKDFNDSEGFKPVHIASLDWKQVIPMGSLFAVIPSISARCLTGATIHPSLANYIGGDVRGRIISQQIPFYGLNEMYCALNNVAVLNLDLRFNPIKNLYISAQGGYMKEVESLAGWKPDIRPSLWGAGLELGYNTVVGPVKFCGRWSSLLNAAQFYMSVGFDF